MSKITETSESQFKAFLKHKRERLISSVKNENNSVLPKLESLFENKDLIKKMNQVKSSLLSAAKGGKKDDKIIMKEKLLGKPNPAPAAPKDQTATTRE